MTDMSQDRPAIHVCLVNGALADLDRWVEIGAEEEGVPTRVLYSNETCPVAAAYIAAQNSRVDIGVAIGMDRVVLHEMHMPSDQPVLNFGLTTADPRLICRLMGANAARLVTRLPLRFEDELSIIEEPVSVEKVVSSEAKQISKPNSPIQTTFTDGNNLLNNDNLTDSDVTRIAKIVTAIVRERGKI